MNELAARMLTGLTAGMRFSGPLNVDLNEITTNLVPFSGMHYLVPSLSPAVTMAAAGIRRAEQASSASSSSAGGRRRAAAAARPSGRGGSGSRLLPGEPRSADALFSDALLRSNALLDADTGRHTYLACGLLARGDVLISDVQRNIERMRASMRMAWFNTDGFKTGICTQPPLDATRSVLALSNNCGIAQTFRRMESSFMRLYTARAHLHHYTDIMGAEGEGSAGLLDGAKEALATLIDDYEHMDGSDTPPEDWAGRGDAALLAAIGIGPPGTASASASSAAPG
jgi:tubulin epsilon